MVSFMQPFSCFMDVESSRTYIDELYSSDPAKCHEAIVCLKNSVIGSNRQKGSVIAQGIVPRLLQLVSDQNVGISMQFEAAVTIGSLAKGNEEHIQSLIDLNCVSILLNTLTNSSDYRLTEACLCALRSIFQHSCAPIEVFHDNQAMLSHILSLASIDYSVTCQACVVSLLGASCRTPVEQNLLSQSGACDVIARLLSSPCTSVQLPALTCLSAMCFENAAVSDVACRTCFEETYLPDLLSKLLSRDRPLSMQLAAGRCMTYLHRAGALDASDQRVVYRALPCLARLCSREHPLDIRSAAAETLAYLAEVDTSLQKLAAISNHLVASLADLLMCSASEARQGAFRCFASLGANDEDIRKRIIDILGLMERVVAGLGDEEADVRLAAVRCLHSLSRSVQQLRTTFQDHSVWRPLMALLSGNPSCELLTVATSTLCNLLLEFSPAKEPMLESGAVELLCQLTHRDEPALRLNGVWALMNMAFQAEQKIKTRILSSLGTDQVFRLLEDTDTRIIMKTLGLLRNLLSTRTHIDAIMSEHSTEVMDAVILVLDGTHGSEVKEQALCILGNIGDGERAKEHIMANDHVLKKLLDYLVHSEPKLQGAALFAIGNLVWRSELGAEERQARLRELGVLTLLQQLVTTSDSMLFEKVKTAIGQFNDA